MEKINKTLRLLGLVVMIMIASIGIGIGGAVPIPSTTRKDDATETKVELLESTDEDEKEGIK